MEERIASHGLTWSSLDKRFDGATRGYSTPVPIYITLRGATAAMLNGNDSLRLAQKWAVVSVFVSAAESPFADRCHKPCTYVLNIA